MGEESKEDDEDEYEDEMDPSVVELINEVINKKYSIEELQHIKKVANQRREDFESLADTIDLQIEAQSNGQIKTYDENVEEEPTEKTSPEKEEIKTDEIDILQVYEEVKKALASGQVNPMQLKLKLASDITRLYHTEEELKDAQRNFAVVYQGAEDESVDLPVLKYATYKLEEDGTCSLIELLYTSGKYKSKSEIRRLIQQGVVKVNGEKYSELSIVPSDDLIIQTGKGKKFKLAEQGYQKSLTQKQAPENR